METDPATALEDDDRFTAFSTASVRLFDDVARRRMTRRLQWEAEHGPLDDEDAPLLLDGPIVCVDHQRFIPCRTCMYDTPAERPYSDLPADVEQVRRHQQR